MCLRIFAFVGSLREAPIFLSFARFFFPLSRIVYAYVRALSLPREKKTKIAKLYAPLLEEPNMVRAFALVDVEHKKLMVLVRVLRLKCRVYLSYLTFAGKARAY